MKAPPPSPLANGFVTPIHRVDDIAASTALPPVRRMFLNVYLQTVENECFSGLFLLNIYSRGETSFSIISLVPPENNKTPSDFAANAVVRNNYSLFVASNRTSRSKWK